MDNIVDGGYMEEEYKQILDKKNESQGRGFWGDLFSTSKFDNSKNLMKKSEKSLKREVLSSVQEFVLSGIHCWQDLDIFLPKRDFLFSRRGICPYTDKDEIAVNQMLKSTTTDKTLNEEAKSKPDGENDQDEYPDSLEQYISQNCNPTHMMVINFLKPISRKFPNEFLESFIAIWLKKHGLPQKTLHQSLLKLI